jgi:hypothetical protein
MTSGGSCESEPFEYKDNSRVVVTGKLIDQSGSPMLNQQIVLKYRYDNSSDIIHVVNSDSDGNFFISAPGANRNSILSFTNKKIVNIQNTYGHTLNEQYGPFKEDFLYLTNFAYEFVVITLKPNE